VARRRMSPEQAQRLAEKYQERYPDASPREIAEIVNDPTQHFYEPILGGMYRGLKIPENMTTPQADAWKAAVDQRMAGFDDRQTALQADARRRLNEEIRSDIAGVVKPASMAASLTPYDLGLGDVGYAAGELIDPEGTYGDAALAAGGGLLTAGLGSGAIMSKAAKEARKGMKRADDVEDLTPTVMYDNPLNFPKGVRGSRARGSTGGSEYQSRAARDAKAYADSMRTPPQFDPSLITKQSTRSVIPPELAIGVGGAAAIGALGKENLRGQEDVSAGARGMGYQDMVDEMAAKPIDPNLSVRMMNEVRKTTDYGNAFAETTDRQSPMNFSSADALSDLPGFYQENRENAARIFEQTGTVPPGMARSLGKYEALMNTRGALLDEEGRMLREGIAFKPSTPIVEDRTAMAGQGGMDREIEPAMGDYGE
jgi:hypothetical protein